MVRSTAGKHRSSKKKKAAQAGMGTTVKEAIVAYVFDESPPGVKIALSLAVDADAPLGIQNATSDPTSGEQVSISVRMTEESICQCIIANPAISEDSELRSVQNQEAQFWHQLLVQSGIANADGTDVAAECRDAVSRDSASGAEDALVDSIKKSVATAFSSNGYSPSVSRVGLAYFAKGDERSSAAFSAQTHAQTVINLILRGPSTATGMALFSPWFVSEVRRKVYSDIKADPDALITDTGMHDAKEIFGKLQFPRDESSSASSKDSPQDWNRSLLEDTEENTPGKTGLSQGLERRLTAFVREIRKQFIDQVKPLHMPEGWSIGYTVLRSRRQDRL